jgi:hypothetical protein
MTNSPYTFLFVINNLAMFREEADAGMAETPLPCEFQ